MSNETKPENATGHGGFERQDLQVVRHSLFPARPGGRDRCSAFSVSGGSIAFLDHRERAEQPAVNPLVTNVPADTRHIAPGYPQSAFPNPKLEEDERGQLNGIRLGEEKTLYSYGWVDEKAGTVAYPDRARHGFDCAARASGASAGRGQRRCCRGPSRDSKKGEKK